jgi:nucleoside 2-deoxyribosyltransferase
MEKILATCFVIQPFDRGKFDKRYADVFEPAIREAGLEPYRVDSDPAVSVPIEDIQNEIKRSSVCLADITLDNPNVWFELGYALASGKEVCLICSEERSDKYPFDVQHRSIIDYKVESKVDFDSLQHRITAKLRAIIDKSETFAIVEAQSPIKELAGLSQHEMMVLLSIAENREGPGSGVPHWIVKEQLSRLGYNNLALNIGLDRLLKKEMIIYSEEQDYNGNHYTLYAITDDGMEWICRNHERLNLRVVPENGRSGKKGFDLDDDIPF